MPEVQQTRLPGVGVRHDFLTAAGTRLGMLSHLDGRRELLVYGRDDPDACRTIALDADDARALGELLGGDSAGEPVAGIARALPGLAVDWLPVTRAGADAGLLSAAGVAVAAVVRDAAPIPAPADDFALLPGDTVVVVGSAGAIADALAALRGA